MHNGSLFNSLLVIKQAINRLMVSPKVVLFCKWPPYPFKVNRDARRSDSCVQAVTPDRHLASFSQSFHQDCGRYNNNNILFNTAAIHVMVIA